MENGVDYVDLRLQIAQLGLQYIEWVEYVIARKKSCRRWWSKPLIRDNYLTGYGGFQRVFQYFKLSDEDEFINFTRMNVQTFNYLYNMVRGRLTKRSWRPSLPPELRLSLTLNYLAHADSIKKTKWFYCIGESTVKAVIAKVCYVLCEVLAPVFVRFPSQQQFRNIANGFSVDLHFPNCIGALDGKHCKIKKPANSGSLFYNYKKIFSIVLMACCDSKKRFIWANIGDYGSLNDAGIFVNSDLGRALLQDQIELPGLTNLPNTQILCPYFLIGDGIFPLTKYLQKPFLRNENLTMVQKIFNYRLSFARRIIENAFGQLAMMWLVHQSTLAWKLSVSERLIMSTICLHNMLIDFEQNEVGNRWNTFVDNRVEIIHNGGIEADVMRGFRIRQQLSEYFIVPAGSVPWQWDKI